MRQIEQGPKTGQEEHGLTQEQKLEKLSFEDREKLENSWVELEKIIGSETEKPDNIDISKVEHKDAKSTEKQSKEFHKLLSGFFSKEETVDAKDIEIGITKDIIQNYVARDEKGKIISYLQSQMIESQGSSYGKPELSLMVWYIATNKEYKGKSPIKDLLGLALKDCLEKSKKDLKPVKAFLGEAEDEIERYANRLGLERIYYKNTKDEACEVPYKCPPEDDSTEGVPTHLAIRLLNGQKSMSVEEFLSLVNGAYKEYARPEYFEDAEEDRQEYQKLVDNMRGELENSLSSASGKLFFMSERERRTGDKE